MNEIVNWWNATFQTHFCKYSDPSRNTFTGSNILFMGSCTPGTELAICSVSLVNIRLFKGCRQCSEPLEHKENLLCDLFDKSG